jgi:N-acetyl-gamma-glutamyl-phosphate reductase
VTIQFTPHLVPVNRGILTTLYLTLSENKALGIQSNRTQAKLDPTALAGLGNKIDACFQDAYRDEPFVRLLQGKALPDTKNVVGTNVIEIGWRLDPRTSRLVVMSAEDNLVKGASGQAVQSLNILCGWPETTGLQ